MSKTIRVSFKGESRGLSEYQLDDSEAERLTSQLWKAGMRESFSIMTTTGVVIDISNLISFCWVEEK